MTWKEALSFSLGCWDERDRHLSGGRLASHAAEEVLCFSLPVCLTLWQPRVEGRRARELELGELLRR